MPKTRGLSGAQLKWIALVTMLLDHIGLALVYLGYLLTHRVDRSPAGIDQQGALRSAQQKEPDAAVVDAPGVRAQA